MDDRAIGAESNREVRLASDVFAAGDSGRNPMGIVANLMAVCALAVVGDTELLFFTGTPCRYCEQVKPAVAELQSQGYPVTTVDIQQQPELADQFAIQQIPAFVLVRNGQEIDRALGTISVQKMISMFEAVEPAIQTPTRELAVAPGDYESPANFNSPSVNAPSANAPQSPAYEPQPFSNDDSHQGWTDHIGFAKRLDAPQQQALASTVRITVTEHQSTAFGSGTIIDQRGSDVLILTCGHLFRDAASSSAVQVEFGFPASPIKVDAMVISFEADDHDIALVVARVDQPVTVAPLARPELQLAAGDPIFSVGCDGGSDPTVFETRVKAITQYVPATKFDTFGRPAQGRSGGGLFTAGGQLIGVCNAAAVEVDEGIFAGPESISKILTINNLQHLLLNPSHLAESDPRILRNPNVAASEAPLANRFPENELASMSHVGAGVRELRIIEQIPGQPGQTREIIIRDPEPELIASLEARAQAGPGGTFADAGPLRVPSRVPTDPVSLPQPNGPLHSVSPGYGPQGELVRGQSPR